MPADPHGAADDRPDPGRRAGLRPQRVVGQERREVRAHADRADARAAAAVRDAERLVQVEVRHVGAELPRPGDADQRVEVGAVDVDLAAGLVHQRAQLGDVLLEHAVRRRVGDHDRGEVVAVLVDLGPQVVEVDVAAVVARDHDDPHAGHHRATPRWCRARSTGSGRRRAPLSPLAAVVGADREQPGELALRAGVGLQRHGVVAGDLGQPALELRRSARGSPAACSTGANGCIAGELRPGDRLHLGGGVELHRARAERDHRRGPARGRWSDSRRR